MAGFGAAPSDVAYHLSLSYLDHVRALFTKCPVCWVISAVYIYLRYLATEKYATEAWGWMDISETSENENWQFLGGDM